MSSAGSQKVRVLIIGYRRFSELINAVMPEFEDEAEVTIVESVASGNTEYHTLVARHAPDVVASAGSNAAYLNATLPVPVISQPVTDTDIVEALAKARRIASDVHLFSYQPEHAPLPRLFNSLPGLLDVEFTHHPYSTSSQAAEMLELAIAEHDPGVIVGPSYTCHMAEQRGLPSILVYSKESARGMLREALRCPVESFEPFESVDLSGLPEHEAEQLQARRQELADLRKEADLRLARLDRYYGGDIGCQWFRGQQIHSGWPQRLLDHGRFGQMRL